ncbi:MAG: bacillithiol system redox-active protein YtxJ [Cytophagales bacterium]|nr:bacillithiol system redox-active protein YtxJ [Cytophagales bacterium]
MNWIHLTDEKQLQEIEEISHRQPVVVFKHSTRCSISGTALGRLERNWNTTEIRPYYLDLLAYRPLSGQVAQAFGIEHQSPQLLLIRDGKCIYHASHWDINYAELMKVAG